MLINKNKGTDEVASKKIQLKNKVQNKIYKYYKEKNNRNKNLHEIELVSFRSILQCNALAVISLFSSSVHA